MSIRRERDGWVLDGKIKRVPFARYADEIVALAILGQDTWIVRIPTERLRLEAGLNLAGEPRDDIILDALAVDAAAVAALPPPVTATSIKARAALGRCFQMLGAMEGAMDLARRYAGTRSQFGRPLAQFQSIQNYLAEVAGEICAVGALVALAVQAGDAEIIDIAAAAKIRTGQAARIVAQRCHQIHGAIGLTHEYGLQLFTRRLWSWREEFGSEAYWADQLGDRLVASGAERLWETIAV
ncbi:acyl-CoA dehydrogenase family protein [Rhodoligotrophos defluvii]|uniref:acyl-CoA dehydrogenase family protein n=1 Tax=Rhodoligotrophos defluvii TaxID=2561934 RepID=UPI0014856E56|nr:acyl-CoA dehydrogenase family protein [Rhodoligotrophos defluvii]